MSVFLTILMIIAGLVMVGSILLMSPKGGGLGFGMAGASAGNGNYGSSKNLETRLRKIAFGSAILFVLLCIILPYTF